VLLQLPLHAPKPLVSVRNWRAETVPAKRTAVTIVANNADLTNLLAMIVPYQTEQRWTMAGPSFQLFCRGFDSWRVADTAAGGSSIRNPAETRTAARHCGAAGASAKKNRGWVGPQHAGRNRSRKENGCDYGRKQCGFHYFPVHNGLSFHVTGPRDGPEHSRRSCSRPGAVSVRLRRNQSSRPSRPSQLFRWDPPGLSAA
jgi:hypothetical protein